MLTKRMKGIGHPSFILAIFTFTFIGLSCVFAGEKLPTWKIDDFRMYLAPALKESVLEEIAAEDSNNQIVELGNWPHSPLEVRSVVADRNIRIRFEEDFLVIWYHGPVSLVDGKNTPLDVIRESVNSILGEAFVIGEADTLITTGSLVNAKSELVMAIWPKEIPALKAIVCHYYSVSDHKRRWEFVSSMYVLAKGKDAVIVMEKKKARTASTPYIYEGLKAARVRLPKEEAESAKSKPVLARNIVFGEQSDTKDISDMLLNGCMWPIDNDLLLGAKKVGSVSELRPKSFVNKRDAKSK